MSGHLDVRGDGMAGADVHDAAYHHEETMMTERPRILYFYNCRAWWSSTRTGSITMGGVPIWPTNIPRRPVIADRTVSLLS
jgi:hypothetical protein